MDIGEALRHARTEAGLTVEDVSRATRIRGQLVREIESGNFANCGGNVYARGHIRSIAQQVGIDPAPLLAEFDRTHGDSDAPAAREIFEHEVIAMPDRTGPNWTAAMAVAAAIMLVIALASVFNSKPTGAPLADAPRPTPSASSASPEPEPSPTAAEQPIAGIITDGVIVQVRVINTRSWVSATVDGRPAFGKTLSAPDQIEFQGDKLVRLVIGNAGAVQLVVNGRDLGTPGRPGAVLRLEFGPGDPTAGNPG